MGSVDQRAAKLLAFKVGVLKKKSAALAIPPKLCAIAFGPGSIPGELKSFSKFDSRQLLSLLTDLKFFAFKDLFPFSIVSKVQETGSILRVILTYQSDLIFIGFI